MKTISNSSAQICKLNFSKVKAAEYQLNDVIELIDITVIKYKLHEIENDWNRAPIEINKIKIGIIYHEIAVNLDFLDKTKFKGYAEKSYHVLTNLSLDPNTTQEFLPFITSYRASALSLFAIETMRIGLIRDAFKLFEDSILQYSNVSYAPEFLRGSAAENLPWFFLSKKKFAKIDMQSLIDKQNDNKEFANNKIMSIVYWARANQNKKNKSQALKYLDIAIALDPNYQAGRIKAEDLIDKLLLS